MTIKTKKIGLKNLNIYHLFGTNLKKDLLYFDEIIINEDNFRLITGVVNGMKNSPDYDKMIKKINEIDFLERKGFIKIEKVPEYFEGLGGDSNLELYSANVDIQKIQKEINYYTSDKRIKTVARLFSIHNIESNLNSRILCSNLNEKGILNIEPIIEINPNDRKFLPNLKNTKITNYNKNIDVINLVLKNIPIPDERVSWDKIIDFKQNTDIEIYRLALFNWISEVGRTDCTLIEIQEKLEYLLKRYEERLKLEKIKFHYSKTELIITTSVEILENILKLKWSKALKRLFDLKREKVDLLIGETIAPGREVAYISKINHGI